jgi:diacylglycerol O-acyltransferase / wax synthase
MDAVPLSDEDRAILELESGAVAGHTCKVVMLGAPAPSVEALRRSVARRIDAAPALSRRLSGPARQPVWVDDDRFDITAHVVAADAAGSADELRERVARLFSERLDRDRPLWRIDVVPLARQASAMGDAAVVWRIHHALADGTTAMRFAGAVLWDAAGARRGEPHRAHPPGTAADHTRRRAGLAAFLRHEVALGAGRSPFDARIGSGREIAFAGARLRPLHDAAKRICGATVNDAVLATVAGSLRGWLQHHHGRLGGLRVQVPVSLHHGDDAGNRDSFFTLELPLGEPDPVARLRAICGATAERKKDHDAETLDRLMRELAIASPGLERFCRKLKASPRAFALSVSNVPGPGGPLTVLGAPVEAVYSIAEIGERHALRIAVVSACGDLRFGFCSDPAIVHDLDRLALGVESEVSALRDAAGPAAGV